MDMARISWDSWYKIVYFLYLLINVPVIVGSGVLLYFSSVYVPELVVDSGGRLCPKAVLKFGEDLKKLSWEFGSVSQKVIFDLVAKVIQNFENRVQNGSPADTTCITIRWNCSDHSRVVGKVSKENSLWFLWKSHFLGCDRVKPIGNQVEPKKNRSSFSSWYNLLHHCTL